MQAVEIVAAAQERAIVLFMNRRRAGFREGFGAGMNAAAQSIQDLERAVETYWKQREAELIEAALAVAHRVVAELPPDDRLRGIVSKALNEHRHDTRLIIRVSADVFLDLQAALKSPGFSHVEIVADGSLSAGTLLLDHALGQTEIGLVGQFRAMLRQASST